MLLLVSLTDGEISLSGSNNVLTPLVMVVLQLVTGFTDVKNRKKIGNLEELGI